MDSYYNQTWSVVSQESLPGITESDGQSFTATSGGAQIWLLGTADGTSATSTRVESFTLDLFTTDYLHLFAVPVPDGGFSESCNQEYSIQLQESDFGTGIVDVGFEDAESDIVFVFTVNGNECRASYNAATDTLFLPKEMAGIGTVTITGTDSAGAVYELTITSHPSGAGGFVPMGA